MVVCQDFFPYNVVRNVMRKNLCL